MHDEDLETFVDTDDRREVLDRIVTGALRHRRNGGERTGVAGEQRVTVGRRGRDHARAKRATRTRPVFDHHRLTEFRGQNL